MRGKKPISRPRTLCPLVSTSTMSYLNSDVPLTPSAGESSLSRTHSLSSGLFWPVVSVPYRGLPYVICTWLCALWALIYVTPRSAASPALNSAWPPNRCVILVRSALFGWLGRDSSRLPTRRSLAQSRRSPLKLVLLKVKGVKTVKISSPIINRALVPLLSSEAITRFRKNPE